MTIYDFLNTAVMSNIIVNILLYNRCCSFLPSFNVEAKIFFMSICHLTTPITIIYLFQTVERR